MMIADGVAPEQWCAGLNRWQRLVLAMIAGAVMTAGHPPVGVPWGMFLALPVLIWLMHATPSGKAAAWTGWAAGFGYFVTSLHWVGNAFLVDPDKFMLLLPLGVLGLPAGLAIFWAIAFWVARRTDGAGWRAALALATTLSAVELARGYILTGFPWALPGYVWLETPLLQAASWAGPFGLTLITLILCSVPMVAGFRKQYVPAIAAILAFAALWISGVIREADALPTDPDAPVIRLVQPNAPQHLKWLPGYREDFYQRLLDSTAAPAADGAKRPDLVIWPEMAVHFVPSENPAEVARIAEAAQGAPVILGAFHREVQGDEYSLTNSLHTILSDGTLGPRYDKHHLVPFGEYMPLVGLLSRLGLPDFSEGVGFSRGDGPTTMHLPGLPSFSPNICYESIFPYQVVGPERPNWIAQITNDAWFGSFAGPQQHLAQARFRAVEQGLPVIRATNTGISAVIDSHGRMVASLNMHNYSMMDVNLPLPIPSTIYSIVGDISCTFMILILLMFIFQRPFIRH